VRSDLAPWDHHQTIAIESETRARMASVHDFEPKYAPSGTSCMLTVLDAVKRKPSGNMDPHCDRGRGQMIRFRRIEA
jgi:hypothetical protein